MALILDGSQQLSLKTPPYVIPTGLSVVFCVQPETESSSFYVLGDYRDSSNAACKSLCLYGKKYGQDNRPYYQNVPGGSSGLGSENYTSSFPQVPQLISYSWTPVGSNSHHTARASAVFANNVFQSINGHVWSASWGGNFINNQNKLYLFDKYAGSGTALRGKVFWVALVNEFWDNTRSKDIHEALLRQDTHIFDDYQHSLIELWDFNDSGNALLGRIGGTPLSIEKGTLSYQPSNVPVSRNTFIGIGQPNILAAPAWLSTLDSPAAGSETINCTAADLALSGHGAGLVELSVIECSAGAVSVGGELCAIYQAQAISCSAAALTLTAAAAQQLEAGDSVISCSTATLALAATAAQQLEAGDSVISCSAASLTLTTAAAQQVEVGDSVIGCVAAALTLTTPSAQQLESGDSVVGCTAAALAVSAPAAQQVEVGDSVIGCAATIVSLDGTTATITDSMGVRSAAVVLDTPGCSIHDFDIIGATTADLSVGSSIAGMVEVGDAVIGTGYADIGITAIPCALITTDAEPIITDIGLVASINQPAIIAAIPDITITARA